MFHLIQFAQNVLAQAEGGAAAPAPNPFGGLMPMFLAMFAVFYLLVWRPGSKERKAKENLLSSLKKDDEVVTSSGIYGKIVAIEGKVVTLSIADKVKIKILLDRIAGLWNPQSAEQK